MATYNINITNNGFTSFVFTGSHSGGALNSSNDPSLTFDVGDVVNFTFNNSGHPFRIEQSGSSVFGDYSSGTYTWNVSSGGMYVYKCTIHPGSMFGNISVAGSVTTTTTETTTTQADTTTTQTSTTQAATTTTQTTTTQADTTTTTTTTEGSSPTSTTTTEGSSPTSTTTTQGSSPTTQAPSPQVTVPPIDSVVVTPTEVIPIPNDGDSWTLPNKIQVYGAAPQNIMDLRRLVQFNFRADSVVYDIVIKNGYVAAGNRDVYYIRDLTTPTLNLYRGKAYIFDLRDPSNAGQPLRFYPRQKNISPALNLGLEPYSKGVEYFGAAGSQYGFLYFTVPEDAPDILYYDSAAGINFGGMVNIKNIPVVTTEPPPEVPPLRLPPDNLYIHDTSSVVCNIQGACVPRTGKGRKSDLRYRIPDYEFLEPLQTTSPVGTTVSASTTTATTSTTIPPDTNPYHLVKYPKGNVLKIEVGPWTGAFGNTETQQYFWVDKLYLVDDETGEYKEFLYEGATSPIDGDPRIGRIGPLLHNVLREGETYTFDQSDPSNSGHRLLFSKTRDGTHNGGVPFTRFVETFGTPGTEGAGTTIHVPYGQSVELFVYCEHHPGMMQGNNPHISVIPKPARSRYDLPNIPDTSNFNIIAPNAIFSEDDKYNYISFNTSTEMSLGYSEDDFVEPSLTFDYIIIGGGGGGGVQDGGGPSGGGGAGAVVSGVTTVNVGNHYVVVGRGGSPGENGTRSSFNFNYANGGGAGGVYRSIGSPSSVTFGDNYFENVGSHGGTGADSSLTTTGDFDYQQLNTFINTGGVSTDSTFSGAGGGGGAGSKGSDTLTESTWKGGNGGDGILINLDPDNVRYYAGGGAGGGSGILNTGNGGKGGGGSYVSVNGQANTGSGGAGNSELDLTKSQNAGSGGSGKIILRYLKDNPRLFDPDAQPTPLEINYVQVCDNEITLIWNPPNQDGIKSYFYIEYKPAEETRYNLSSYVLSDKYKTYKTFRLPYNTYDFRISIADENDPSSFIRGSSVRVPVIDLDLIYCIKSAVYNPSLTSINIELENTDPNFILRFKVNKDGEWSDAIPSPNRLTSIDCGGGLVESGDKVIIQCGILANGVPVFKDGETEVLIIDPRFEKQDTTPYIKNLVIKDCLDELAGFIELSFDVDDVELAKEVYIEIGSHNFNFRVVRGIRNTCRIFNCELNVSGNTSVQLLVKVWNVFGETRLGYLSYGEEEDEVINFCTPTTIYSDVPSYSSHEWENNLSSHTSSVSIDFDEPWSENAIGIIFFTNYEGTANAPTLCFPIPEDRVNKKENGFTVTFSLPPEAFDEGLITSCGMFYYFPDGFDPTNPPQDLPPQEKPEAPGTISCGPAPPAGGVAYPTPNPPTNGPIILTFTPTNTTTTSVTTTASPLPEGWPFPPPDPNPPNAKGGFIITCNFIPGEKESDTVNQDEQGNDKNCPTQLDSEHDYVFYTNEPQVELNPRPEHQNVTGAFCFCVFTLDSEGVVGEPVCTKYYNEFPTNKIDLLPPRKVGVGVSDCVATLRFEDSLNIEDFKLGDAEGRTRGYRVSMETPDGTVQTKTVKYGRHSQEYEDPTYIETFEIEDAGLFKFRVMSFVEGDDYEHSSVYVDKQIRPTGDDCLLQPPDDYGDFYGPTKTLAAPSVVFNFRDFNSAKIKLNHADPAIGKFFRFSIYKVVESRVTTNDGPAGYYGSTDFTNITLENGQSFWATPKSIADVHRENGLDVYGLELDENDEAIVESVYVFEPNARYFITAYSTTGVTGEAEDYRFASEFRDLFVVAPPSRKPDPPRFSFINGRQGRIELAVRYPRRTGWSTEFWESELDDLTELKVSYAAILEYSTGYNPNLGYNPSTYKTITLDPRKVEEEDKITIENSYGGEHVVFIQVKNQSLYSDKTSETVEPIEGLKFVIDQNGNLLISGVDDTGTEFYDDFNPDLDFWYKGEGSTLCFELVNHSLSNNPAYQYELYIAPAAAHPYHEYKCYKNDFDIDVNYSKGERYLTEGLHCHTITTPGRYQYAVVSKGDYVGVAWHEQYNAHPRIKNQLGEFNFVPIDPDINIDLSSTSSDRKVMVNLSNLNYGGLLHNSTRYSITSNSGFIEGDLPVGTVYIPTAGFENDSIEFIVSTDRGIQSAKHQVYVWTSPERFPKEGVSVLDCTDDCKGVFAQVPSFLEYKPQGLVKRGGGNWSVYDNGICVYDDQPYLKKLSFSFSIYSPPVLDDPDAVIDEETMIEYARVTSYVTVERSEENPGCLLFRPATFDEYFDRTGSNPEWPGLKSADGKGIRPDSSPVTVCPDDSGKYSNEISLRLIRKSVDTDTPYGYQYDKPWGLLFSELLAYQEEIGADGKTPCSVEEIMFLASDPPLVSDPPGASPDATAEFFQFTFTSENSIGVKTRTVGITGRSGIVTKMYCLHDEDSLKQERDIKTPTCVDCPPDYLFDRNNKLGYYFISDRIRNGRATTLLNAPTLIFHNYEDQTNEPVLQLGAFSSIETCQEALATDAEVENPEDRQYLCERPTTTSAPEFTTTTTTTTTTTAAPTTTTTTTTTTTAAPSLLPVPYYCGRNSEVQGGFEGPMIPRFSNFVLEDFVDTTLPPHPSAGNAGSSAEMNKREYLYPGATFQPFGLQLCLYDTNGTQYMTPERITVVRDGVEVFKTVDGTPMTAFGPDQTEDNPSSIPPSEYIGYFGGVVKLYERAGSTSNKFGDDPLFIGDDTYYQRVYCTIKHPSTLWSYEESQIPNFDDITNYIGRNVRNLDFNWSSDKCVNFDYVNCRGVREAVKLKGYYNNDPTDEQTIVATYVPFVYQEAGKLGDMYSCLYIALMWEHTGEFLDSWPNYWYDNEDDLFYDISVLYDEDGEVLVDNDGEPVKNPFAVIQQYSVDGDIQAPPPPFNGTSANACDEDGNCVGIPMFGRAFKITKEYTLSVVVEIQRQYVETQHHPVDPDGVWETVGVESFQIKAEDTGCFHENGRILVSQTGEEFFLTLEPMDLDYNFLDDWPIAYDIKIEEDKLSFSYDTGNGCNARRFIHDSLAVSNDAKWHLAEEQTIDQIRFSSKAFVVQGSDTKAQLINYIKETKIVSEGYHTYTEEPLLDVEGNPVLNDDGTPVMRSVYGAYVPPRYSFLVILEDGSSKRYTNRTFSQFRKDFIEDNDSTTFNSLLVPGQWIAIRPPTAPSELSNRVSGEASLNRSNTKMLESRLSVGRGPRYLGDDFYKHLTIGQITIEEEED